MTANRGPGVEGTIEGFSPTSVSAAAAAFARDAVASARPADTVRAKALLFAAAKLADFAHSTGLELRAEVLLRDVVIERFILSGATTLRPATRRTLRSNLRALSRGVVPHEWEPAALSRERAKAPYTRSEIAAYLALAAAQPTRSRRLRANGLIALGAGAGLMGADLRAVRGGDVVARSGGLVVVVAGIRPRVVPVLRRYHELLIESAALAAQRYVVGGTNPQRHNVTTPLISSLAGGVDLGRLDTGRLRSTWLAECAEGIGLSSFMAAAGITCSQRLGDIVACLPAASETEMVVRLGATG